MRTLRNLLLKGLMALCLWTLAPGIVFAQAAADSQSEGRAYVLQYVMVVVLIGLAMFVICKPSPRRPAEGKH